MSDVVDLRNLREMLGDNRDIEKQFFEKFYLAAQKCMTGMDAACTANDHEMWRSNAHALKGVSLNLGAMQLGTLCAAAQAACEQAAPEKQKLLAEIKEAYAAAEQYLKTI